MEETEDGKVPNGLVSRLTSYQIELKSILKRKREEAKEGIKKKKMKVDNSSNVDEVDKGWEFCFQYFDRLMKSVIHDVTVAAEEALKRKKKSVASNINWEVVNNYEDLRERLDGEMISLDAELPTDI